MDNLIEVAVTATKYPQFEEVSNIVTMSCAKFLEKNIGESDKLQVEFVLTQYASGNVEIAMKLLSLVKQLQPSESSYNSYFSYIGHKCSYNPI